VKDKADIKQGKKTKSEIHSIEMMDDLLNFSRQNSGMFGLTKPIGKEVTLQSPLYLFQVILLSSLVICVKC